MIKHGMDTSLDLRRRVVAAYRSGMTATYAATAAVFGIGEATVSRILRRYRETGDVAFKPRGGNRARVVDDVWLLAHASAEPDARLVDRIAAWATHSGRTVSLGAMHDAMKRIGWTHKKKLPLRGSGTRPQSKSAATRSSPRRRASTRRG